MNRDGVVAAEWMERATRDRDVTRVAPCTRDMHRFNPGTLEAIPSRGISASEPIEA